MNYKDAFKIDSLAYNKKGDTPIEPCQLNNFDYYNPKLVNDFYLKYFTKVLLFEIDILELEDFLDFHYGNCENPNKLLKILDLKIPAKIDEIISNAIFSLDGDFGIKTIKLDAGLVENDRFIYHPQHEDSFYYYTTALNNLQGDLEKRKSIINDYILKVSFLKDINNQDVLKWKGKPSHLALIIKELIDYGYIEPPLRLNKDINISELARNILTSFNVVNNTTENTLREYSKEDSLKYITLKEKFIAKGFHLPNSAEFD